ncbi:adenylate/guanylate cyclase domain-containing protein [Nocardioides sp. LS1]|uniref:ATP-binding protein n=1 Tax=Nocardioides sp. LS1 TaxID=1027620 RepID=UPI000F6196A3|nr:adenylate/guanylate cyclase domain-containing protein [Nocardioides sp. LS1]
MDVLPSGTVSLLFSDIEGSTALLSRLGASYADALTGQRRVLRAAWAAYDGTELGTEGDSFYVVFSTAGAAVAAATRAQRDLAAFAWPGGEQVRVRIGIHTGSPEVHEGAYVGMDVHRAARIAAAAHGGQVVVSESTASLVAGSLPADVVLRDLGSHQLKDIPRAAHLFQVSVAGLQADFPPLKTLGAVSSLPTPTTPLVGRDAELADLVALVRSPGLRLVTLTGPGGAGKTRLAIGAAARLMETFPDGVFFVPLAAATTPEVMWMTIAEVLGAPAETRLPPAFLEHVAHLSALLVLDNLEQLPGADAVVSQLLGSSPRTVVIATSRRPLHVSGEHEHPVPTLELPDRPSLEEAAQSGAVQLFVQQASMVRPSFALSDDNVGDVVEVCRRLDGLPLAIELAAARSKLLTPAALLARLGTALELRDPGVDRPTRQQTLRATIGWSHDLLPATQQAVFCRLGVFAGGADLEGVEAVCADRLGDTDPLDVVADLVDASLVSVGQGPGGEPRVSMLETVRVYALDELRATGELDDVRRRHAAYVVAVLEALEALQRGAVDRLLEGRQRFETEHDNVREALAWALDAPGADPTRADLAMRLCLGASGWWQDCGCYSEARGWLERAIALAGHDESPELAGCLTALTTVFGIQCDFARAHGTATRSVAVWRQLAEDGRGDNERLSSALRALGSCELNLGHADAARTALQEAVSVAAVVGDRGAVADALRVLAFVEASEQDLERAVELAEDAITLYDDLGDEHGAMRLRHSHACYLRLIGRADEAQRRMQDLVPDVLRLGDAGALLVLAEDYGAVLAEVGHHHEAALLLGAADTARAREGAPREPPQQAQIEAPYAVARVALADAWDRSYASGRAMGIEDALSSLPDITPSAPRSPSA